MPGSLVTSVLSFFASHLVVLTLLAFLVVGAKLIAPGEDNPAASTDEVTESTTPAAVPEAAGAPLQSETEGGMAASQQPVLIGGSLPNYGTSGKTPFRSEPLGSESIQASWSDRDVLVQEARRAFWNGDFEGAEAAYFTLISQHPDDADAFGELGNLYQSMGKPSEALDAYYAAAERLRASGMREKLSEVIDLLDTYNYPDTDRLRP